MTWLIACERSGRIRDAMLAEGIDAVSCDIEPTDTPGPHIQGDVLEVLDKRWAGVIAHPPCTYLTNSSSSRLYVGPKGSRVKDEDRWQKMREGAAFFNEFFKANTDYLAIENPIMHRHAFELIGSRATQFVQPWWFGEPIFKATGFHLKNLPKLVPTNKLTPPEKGTEEYRKWSRLSNLSPSPDRARLRSETSKGVARAVAQQWGHIPYGT